MINENEWRRDTVIKPVKMPFSEFKEYFEDVPPWGTAESSLELRVVQTLYMREFPEIVNFGIPTNKTDTGEIFYEGLEEETEIDNFPMIFNFKDRPSICIFFYVEGNGLKVFVPIHGNNIHPERLRPFKVGGMLDETYVEKQGFKGCSELPKPDVEICLLDFERSKRNLLECLSF